MSSRFQGIVTPLLTPYNDDLSVAHELYAEHAAYCLAQGVHYLSPFGTTGEALSHSVRERMDVLEKLIASGVVKPDQLMPGTGLCNHEDTALLTRHAVDLGCAATMVLPPFFYVNASDDGLFRAYAQLIEAVGSDRLRICLYNIPQMSGMAVSPALTARLSAAYPNIVVAYKDSSGDWGNTKAVINAAPDVSVFPGSESLMVKAMRIGGGGCISASCNSNAAGIRALFDHAHAGHWEQAEALAPQIDAHRQAVQSAGLIPGLKALKAHQTGDQRWLNLRPPLLPADPGLAADLENTLFNKADING